MGVNYADCICRMGLYASARKYVGYPMVPGFEFAGIVEAVGSKVDDVRPGARVVGVTRFGGYATAITVPRHQVFDLPHGFSEEEAAGFPAVFLTAHYALLELALTPANSDAEPRCAHVIQSQTRMPTTAVPMSSTIVKRGWPSAVLPASAP